MDTLVFQITFMHDTSTGMIVDIENLVCATWMLILLRFDHSMVLFLRLLICAVVELDSIGVLVILSITFTCCTSRVACWFYSVFLLLQAIWRHSAVSGQSSPLRWAKVAKISHHSTWACLFYLFQLFKFALCRPANPADVERLRVLQKQRR